MKRLYVVVTLLSISLSTHAKPLSCAQAYTKALSSLSISDVSQATAICVKASEKLCLETVEKNSDGLDTGDGRYVSASCELSLNYGANKGLNKGRPTAKCAKAVRIARQSPSIGDVINAQEICQKDNEALKNTSIAAHSDGPETGDGRYVAAMGELAASHGSYLEVRPK